MDGLPYDVGLAELARAHTCWEDNDFYLDDELVDVDEIANDYLY